MKVYHEGTEHAYTEYEFSDLIGKTLTSVVNHSDDAISFETSDGESFQLYHCQDCCEMVSVESITGDLEDLIGTPILVAEERTDTNDPSDVTFAYREDSQTWTFYTLRTIKGSVDIRWYGTSNGYYSESVSFCKT